ncbi:MAG: nucleotidyltransferase family protein [Magnetospirillum sp.]|nr:nucleotidyltransferase family protein [Magnetospirillum sp.]
MSGLSALVLAGRRPGGDPLARAYALPHKAALPLAGRPMGAWVVEALRACPAVGRVVVAGDGLGLPGVEAMAAADTIGATVEAALDALGTPLLVTTIDHPLLTPAMIAEFLDKVPAGADCAVAVARADTVLGAYPEARRTWLRFRCARVTGCNLFLLAGPPSRQVVRYWTRMDTRRKDPAAMARALGLRALALWSLGLLTVDGAARRLSRRVGARLAVVEMSRAEAAIDVDKPEDVRLAQAILARRTSY